MEDVKSLELPKQKDILLKTKERIEDNYHVKEELGKGKFGVVKKVEDKRNGKIYAAKWIKITAASRDETMGEVTAMNKVHSKRLIFLHDAYETKKDMIIVLEFISGGELFEKVASEDNLTEVEAARYIKQVLQGVFHMHSKKIVHLDLKPENILCIPGPEGKDDIKLIDFGMAREVSPGLKVTCGTPEFVAPEILKCDEVTLYADMWSIGVIAYVLLSGLSPFAGETDTETLQNVTEGEFDFEDDEGSFDNVSEIGKEFIEDLLFLIPTDRMTVKECLQHEWITEKEELCDKKLCTNNLKKFIARRRWQKTGAALRALTRMTGSMNMNNSEVKKEDKQINKDDSKNNNDSRYSKKPPSQRNGTTSHKEEINKEKPEIEKSSSRRVPPSTRPKPSNNKDSLSNDKSKEESSSSRRVPPATRPKPSNNTDSLSSDKSKEESSSSRRVPPATRPKPSNNTDSLFSDKSKEESSSSKRVPPSTRPKPSSNTDSLSSDKSKEESSSSRRVPPSTRPKPSNNTDSLSSDKSKEESSSSRRVPPATRPKPSNNTDSLSGDKSKEESSSSRRVPSSTRPKPSDNTDSLSSDKSKEESSSSRRVPSSTRPKPSNNTDSLSSDKSKEESSSSRRVPPSTRPKPSNNTDSLSSDKSKEVSSSSRRVPPSTRDRSSQEEEPTSSRRMQRTSDLTDKNAIKTSKTQTQSSPKEESKHGHKATSSINGHGTNEVIQSGRVSPNVLKEDGNNESSPRFPRTHIPSWAVKMSVSKNVASDNSDLRVENPEKFYTWGDEIGRGEFAIVKSCAAKGKGLPYAAKFIKYEDENDKMMGVREYDIIKEVDHVNINKLIEGYLVRKYIVLIFEFVDGRDILAYTAAKLSVTEDTLALLTRQAMDALKYIHEKSIVHLDIRPDNLMVSKSGELKIIDFGCARKLSQGVGAIGEVAGNSEFRAPELFNFEPASISADMWSYGIIMFGIVTGKLPYTGENDEEILEKMNKSKVDFSDAQWKRHSANLPKFIGSLVVKNPDKRMTAAQALEHEWLGFAEAKTRKKNPIDNKKLRELKATLDELDDEPISASCVIRTFDDEEYESPESEEEDSEED